MQKLKVEDTYFPTNKHIRIEDNLIDLSTTKIMGIINCTPDSFYAGSRNRETLEILKNVEKHLSEGAHFIDIGGYSSRPGASSVSIQEEINRVLPAIVSIKKEFPQCYISLDTFNSEVANIGLENGVSIINDISAFNIDPQLLDIVAKHKCPYILMHMVGTPENMMQNTLYNSIYNEMIKFFSHKISILKENGINDIIIDPGFGFSKTIQQNYEILNSIDNFELLGRPTLIGISRKSMIYKKLAVEIENSLNGTTILNTLSYLKGASILRVHDVKEAKEIIDLLDFCYLNFL